MNETTIRPVLLAGGIGTRLWPVSRRSYPKQFVELFGTDSLFRQTAARVEGAPFLRPLVLGNEEHRFLIAEQLRDTGVVPDRILLEPCMRNTAPAVCVATLTAEAKSGAEELILLCPCDHVIHDREAFLEAINKGVRPALNGAVVVFGVIPDTPHTGYGYIELAGGTDCDTGSHAVRRFHEKPDHDTASTYLATGHHLWNSGLFLFRRDIMLKAFGTLQPGILEQAKAALDGAREDFDFIRLDEMAYAQAPSISFDHAIMERMEPIRCVSLATDWSDCGAWHAVHELLETDGRGNATRGDVILEGTSNSLILTEEACVVAAGLEDIVAIATRDAILVASSKGVGELGAIVKRLEQSGRKEAAVGRRVHRPWGWYESLALSTRYQVKRLMVKPGASLSLQSHVHRAEHWIVVSGTVEVTRADDVFLLSENESTYIPVGTKHRLANRGRIPALLIEVQSGSYLGEDDIIRYEDVYGRGSGQSPG